MNFYNNKKHRLIGMSPNEADNIRDEDTIKRINEIKNREFEKINKSSSHSLKSKNFYSYDFISFFHLYKLISYIL